MSLKLAVLISGEAREFKTVARTIATKNLDATIDVVISSNEDAPGLVFARESGFQTMALSPDIFVLDPQLADEIIASELLRREVDYVIISDYAQPLSEALTLPFKDKIILAHPSLLPAFPRRCAIEDAWIAGVKVTGATVHFAHEFGLQGPIIAQKPVIIHEGMGLEPLEEAIAVATDELFEEVVDLLVAGRIFIKGDQTVKILPAQQ